MKQVPIQREHSGPPGIVVSALRGGSGKTILSIGIIAALRNLNCTVAPFKKGPDYIDAGWLTLAAGRPCCNLDSFLVDPNTLLQSFFTRTRHTDLAVVEGNRGLYDAPETSGETSTAELAKLLGLPVLLSIDCTKTTRTMAAVVAGCEMFDPDVNIRGVILNRVAGARHESILKRSIEGHCGIPVVGAVPKLKSQHFPERHMGLVPTPEHDWARASVEAAAEMAAAYLDIDSILNTAHRNCAPKRDGRKCEDPVENKAYGICESDMPAIEIGEPRQNERPDPAGSLPGSTPPVPVVGILRDSAFQFYYPENLEALEAAGARLVFTSPLSEKMPPDVHALYIGGGFPETHADALSRNETYRNAIRRMADDGMPVYAECGGLMYLGQALVLDDRSYPMAGVLPLTFGFSQKPQGHGYTMVTVEKENPYFEVGTEIRGHEFHYSSILRWEGSDDMLVFGMRRGNGILEGKDGACFKNVLATYTHIHALGLPRWAEALVRNARAYQKQSQKQFQPDGLGQP